MYSRDEYFKLTNNNPSRKFLIDFIEKYQTGNIYTEIGSWAGNDTTYLLSKWFTVYAIDGNELSKQYILEKISNECYEQFYFEKQSLSNLTLKESDVIYSAFTLPFCEKESFDSMMKNIIKNITIWWFFVWNFFWENDDWKNLSLLTEYRLKSYFKDFDILEITNREYDKWTARDTNSIKHWHEIIIIAKKLS